MSIEFRNVSARYSPTGPWVLDDVDLTLAPGRRIGIVGRSGVGKSTLLRLLSGLMTVEEGRGSVRCFGECPDKYRRRGQIGLVFQDYKLLPHLTVEQNILFPFKVAPWLAGPLPLDRLEALLTASGMASAREKKPHQLSGGMRARTALLRAIIHRPSMLLIDEAFSALDVSWRASLYQIAVSGLSKSSMLLFVTHDLSDLPTFCDDVIVMTNPNKLKIHSRNSNDDLIDPQMIRSEIMSEGI